MSKRHQYDQSRTNEFFKLNSECYTGFRIDDSRLCSFTPLKFKFVIRLKFLLHIEFIINKQANL